MAKPALQVQTQHRVQMGLGDAIRRMVQLEIAHANGFDVSPALQTESKLIMDALNIQYQLDLGFDCDNDGVPDTVEIFAKSAETSCCRILPMDEKPKKTKGKSRAQKADSPSVEAKPEVSAPVEPSPAPPQGAPSSKKKGGLLSALFGGE